MTDRNKFEEMLERLVNEDREGAEALFHEIVVEKSRDIYESLLEDEEVEEATDEEVDEATDEEVDESEEDLDEATDEEVDESEEDLDEASDDEIDEAFFDEMGGDPTDDMMGAIEMPADDMGGDMDMEPEMGDDDMGMGGEEPATKDDIADLAAELDALKAEFEDYLEDEGEEEGADDMGDMDMDDEGDDEEDEEEMPMDMDSEPEDEMESAAQPKSAGETMREYVEKVSPKMGDNGANTQSAVAKPNNMGGTASNIAQSKEGGHPEAGAGKTVQGSSVLKGAPKEESAGNINVPGGKAAKAMKAMPKGHGAEKKGAGENADSSAGSIISGN